jgi:hypothetical protein
VLTITVPSHNLGILAIPRGPGSNTGTTMRSLGMRYLNIFITVIHQKDIQGELTLWSWSLLERPLDVRPLDSFPAFHGTRKFNTESTTALHLFLSLARPIQSTSPHPTSPWSTQLRLGLPSYKREHHPGHLIHVLTYRIWWCIKRRRSTKKKLHGLSPRANYTDRATAACRRSDCQFLRIEGATWSAW